MDKTAKKQTKLDKIKDLCFKRRKYLENSIKKFSELENENKMDGRAREYLTEITRSRLDEINGVLTLIDSKNPLSWESSFVSMDVLPGEETINDKHH
ncbi:hypothetical protein [Treponema sp. R80B11-R83G3]